MKNQAKAESKLCTVSFTVNAAGPTAWTTLATLEFVTSDFDTSRSGFNFYR
jgi:hypothetical protein